MQISRVSLALTWPCRLCLLRFLLCAMPLLQAFPFPSTLGEVTLHPLSQASVFIYSSRGKWFFPPLLWSFPPSAILTSFPTPDCWAHAPAPTLSGQAWLVYLQFCEGFPSPLFSAQGAPPSLLCVFIVLIAYYSVSLFFPRWGSVCPGSYADLAQGCLWKYRVILWSASSQAIWAQATGGGPGALLVSPFNVKYRCSALAGGVEESKFCLFSVVLPARYVSSISPRFYFRRHAFCFLPVAAIFPCPPCCHFLALSKSL
jgi:hypothetical protein